MLQGQDMAALDFETVNKLAKIKELCKWMVKYKIQGTGLQGVSKKTAATLRKNM